MKTESPVRRIVEQLEPLMHGVDQKSRKMYEDLKADMDRSDTEALRDMESIKNKLLMLSNQNDQ